MAEFEKIFKAKSGNEWSNLDNFENKPFKYRLVDREKTSKVAKKAIRFDFDKSPVACTLHKEVKSIIEDISSVSMLVKAYKNICNDLEGKCNKTSKTSRFCYACAELGKFREMAHSQRVKKPAQDGEWRS